MKLRILLLTLISGIMSVSTAHAAPITFTFTGEDGLASLNGATAAEVDLTILLTGDTDDFLADVGSGGRGYNNLSATVSSSALGLVDVASTDVISLIINATAFNAGVEDSVLLQANGAGPLNGLFSVGGAFAAYDGVSNLSQTFAAALASGPLVLALADGSTLVITNLDNAAPFSDSSFSASVVPVPGAIVLFLSGLGLMAGAQRKALDFNAIQGSAALPLFFVGLGGAGPFQSIRRLN